MVNKVPDQQPSEFGEKTEEIRGWNGLFESGSWSRVEAQEVLKPYRCVESAPRLLLSEAIQIQRGLLSLSRMVEALTIGICSESVEEGYLALKEYVAALHQPLNFDFPPRSGAVYIKFNSRGHQWLIEDYNGHSRGVLVAFHSNREDGVNGIYGHFPLDLFRLSHECLSDRMPI